MIGSVPGVGRQHKREALYCYPLGTDLFGDSWRSKGPLVPITNGVEFFRDSPVRRFLRSIWCVR